jgi:ribonuclease G
MSSLTRREALTTVDVPTGGFVWRQKFRQCIFQNQFGASPGDSPAIEARNLGGIVIVDFIDMIKENHRDAVLEEFKSSLRATV